MIAYAVGEKTVCGRPMESGTKALVATPAGARSMIAVPLLNRMKMADGAFDWDGYALVGNCPGPLQKRNRRPARRVVRCSMAIAPREFPRNMLAANPGLGSPRFEGKGGLAPKRAVVQF